MATLFIEYQQMVMQVYEGKRVNNALPHGLMHLTPANLKDECVNKCTKDVNKRDEKVIRNFCGDLNESRNCQVIIQRCETDRFRPLVNYLKGRSESTEAKNIELLAWLIDFSGRPWEIGKTIFIEDDINEGLAPNNGGQAREDGGTAPDSPANPPATGGDKPAGNPNDDPKEKEETGIKIPDTGNKERAKSTKKLATAVMLSLVLGTGSMWWWIDKNQPPAPSGNCMYWLEDHYKPIACNQKIPNAMVIALDTMKLKNFRKITRPDTITYQAIGKVWYSKINGKIEYYTSGGEHPVVFDRELKPITVYIINKYILSGMITNIN
jgi:hypothetical protein